jgi:uncharacterized protein YhaN
MSTSQPPRVRFQISIRTLLSATALFALLLAPLAWFARERQQVRQLLDAREAALQAVIRAERQVRDATISVDDSGRITATVSPPASGNQPNGNRLGQLERENAELKDEVAALRHRLERLEGGKPR